MRVQFTQFKDIRKCFLFWRSISNYGFNVLNNIFGLVVIQKTIIEKIMRLRVNVIWLLIRVQRKFSTVRNYEKDKFYRGNFLRARGRGDGPPFPFFTPFYLFSSCVSFSFFSSPFLFVSFPRACGPLYAYIIKIL